MNSKDAPEGSYSGPTATPSDDDDRLLKAIAGVRPRAPPEQDPTRIGHYRIIERLGRGGMGIVFRAEDEKLRRPVALKLLPKETNDDADRRRRFLHEARAAAAVTHPHVAAIYDVDEADGRLYIAMELVTGESLRARLARGRLPMAELLRIARGIARGLATAHRSGIIHRDLKPENVVLGPDGEPKILDFGLAKLAGGSAGQTVTPDQPTEAHLTREGAVLGTPAYMSPEQARGEAVEAPSDVFSFGVMLYEMAAARRPFSGTNTAETTAALLRDEPRPASALNPEVPAALERVISKCLAKKQKDRYADGSELSSALEEFDTDSRTRRPRWAYVVLPAALVAVGYVALTGRGPIRPATAPPATPGPAPEIGVAITDRPPPQTTSPEAAALFASAMQEFRDASQGLVLKHLARAVELDPSFAAGHLWLARMLEEIGGGIEERRKHLAVARSHRGVLSELDTAMLDVLQADLSTDNLDYQACADRWVGLAQRFPLDAAFTYLAGHYAIRVDPQQRALDLFRRAVRLDPKFALPYNSEAMYLHDTGEWDGGMAMADKCLAVSPSAASCLRRRLEIEARIGDCSRLEADARRELAIEPDAPQGYEWLAVGLASKNAPIESIVQTIKKSQAFAFESGASPFLREWASTKTAPFLDGNLTELISAFPQLEKARREVSDLNEADGMAGMEMDLDEEIGEPASALAVGEDFLREVPALTAQPGINADDVLNKVLALRYHLGHLSEADYQAQQEKHLKDMGSRMSRLDRGSLWFTLASHVNSAWEARFALEALPRYAPIPFFEGEPHEEEVMGRVLLLGGKAPDAVPHLRRATAACFGPDDLATHVRAAERLGEALALQGETDGACKAFGEVLARWPNPKPRSITVDAAREGMKKLGCAK